LPDVLGTLGRVSADSSSIVGGTEAPLKVVKLRKWFGSLSLEIPKVFVEIC